MKNPPIAVPMAAPAVAALLPFAEFTAPAANDEGKDERRD
jgi:hypothetical protein